MRAFVLSSDKAKQFVPEQAEIVEGDLCDEESLERFFTVQDGIETIVLHIASIVTVNPDYSQKVMDVNVGGVKNIISLCLKHKECKKLVYCSSTGAIPELPKGQKMKEVYFFDEKKVLGCYSQSKALGTQVVLDAVRENDLNACVVHPSGILGPEDFAVGETTQVIIQIINGEMPMGIKWSFNLCDVRDLAKGCIGAADKGRKGKCYILGNKEVDFQDFTKIVAEESSCKSMKVFLPGWIANFLAKILEKQAKKKGERPLMTTFSVYNLIRNNDFDSSKAEKELGYRARSYRETVRDEIDWLKRMGKITC